LLVLSVLDLKLSLLADTDGKIVKDVHQVSDLILRQFYSTLTKESLALLEVHHNEPPPAASRS